MQHEVKHGKRFIGIVRAARMQKTVIVEITRQVSHPKYEKRYKVKKRYKAHDEKGEYKVGDTVLIEEKKPFSRQKHFTVIRKA